MAEGIVGPNGAPLNTDGAKMIMGDDQLRAKQAAEEIRVILDAYDAELFPVMMLSPRGVVGVTVDIIPKQRPQMPQGPVATEPVKTEEAPAEDGEVTPDEQESATVSQEDSAPKAEVEPDVA